MTEQLKPNERSIKQFNDKGVWVGGTTSYLDSLPHELQVDIMKKRLPPYGWPPKRISKWLKEEKGIQLGSSPGAIWKWIKKHEATMAVSVYGNEEFQKKAGRVMDDALGEYFTSLLHMTKLHQKVCKLDKKTIELSQQARLASDLFEAVRQGTLSAKELEVGKGDAGNNIVDLNSMAVEFDKMPLIQVVKAAKEPEDTGL